MVPAHVFSFCERGGHPLHKNSARILPGAANSAGIGNRFLVFVAYVELKGIVSPPGACISSGNPDNIHSVFGDSVAVCSLCNTGIFAKINTRA